MDSTAHEESPHNVEKVAVAFHITFKGLDVLISLVNPKLKFLFLNLSYSIFADLLILWINLLCTNWFLISVVELQKVWMLKCLLNCQSLVWIELEKLLQQIKSFFGGSREHVLKLLVLGWR